MRKTLIILLVLYTSFASWAQEKGIRFDRISIEHGLSQSTVSAVVQDSLGFVWFATSDGLNRYDGYTFKVYRHEPGNQESLSENNITSLFVDSQGALWVGTVSKGLCCYLPNLDRFVRYRNDIENPKTLSSDYITALYQDEKQNLWVGTLNGLNRIDHKTKEIRRFLNQELDNNSISSNEITHITGDSNGNLWISTAYGLNRFSVYREVFFAYRNKMASSSSLTSNLITCALADTGNHIWIGTQHGLNRLNLNTNRFEAFFNRKNNKRSISDDNITSLLRDSNGKVWIGTANGGLNRYNAETNDFTPFLYDPGDAKSLSVNAVKCIYQDQAEVFWVGTYLGGINKWNYMVQGLETYRNNPYDSNSLNSNQIREIYEDSLGMVWIGTVDRGVSCWNPKTGNFESYKHDPADTTTISHEHIRSILEDSYGQFWFGTDGGGINLFDRETKKFRQLRHSDSDENSIPGDQIWKIYEDSKHYIWLASFDGGLSRYNAVVHKMTHYEHNDRDSTSIASNKVTNVIEDNDGNVWVGTYDAGISKLKRGRNSFTHIVPEPGNPRSLSDSRVLSLFKDSEGIIWVGTSKGLNRYDAQTDDFTVFTTEQGLRSGAIADIVEDESGFLWLSTFNGLVKLNRGTGEIRNYDVRDGLQSNEFLTGAAFHTRSGRLLFGGINGMNAFWPKDIRENKRIPNLAITNFLVNNEAFPLDTSITAIHQLELLHNQNTFSFNFVAFNFIFSEKNEYAFMLEGVDKGWNHVGNMRYAHYSQLRPDTYVFRVKGSNNDGLWNEEGVAVRIIIHPAFWQTKLFKTAVAILVAFIVLMGFRYRLNLIEKQKRKLEDLVVARTHEIHQQNEEIKTQRDEIEEQRDEIIAQRDDVERQRDQLTLKNREIHDSIVYAERIQRATIPNENLMPNSVSDFFVFFRPKDIVSGDFYWIGEQNGKQIFVAADCTGHGVPGAFMSMLGTSFLNKIINEKGVTKAGEILDRLRENVIHALHQTGQINEARDGMDIAVCVYDKPKQTLEFAGANNPLYRVSEGEVSIVKGDKMPIAIYDEMRNFTTHEFRTQPGDCFYIFSDGYADQFGGENNKKYKYKPFRELLVSNCKRPMLDQKQILLDSFENWRGENEQVDDIVVMGFRI